MAAARLKKRPRPQQPSETYEARAARGRPLISVAIDRDLLARLDAARTKRGLSRPEAIAEAVEAWLRSKNE